MKCPVCFTEIDEFEIECPICYFSKLNKKLLSNSEQEEWELEITKHRDLFSSELIFYTYSKGYINKVSSMFKAFTLDGKDVLISKEFIDNCPINRIFDRNLKENFNLLIIKVNDFEFNLIKIDGLGEYNPQIMIRKKNNEDYYEKISPSTLDNILDYLFDTSFGYGIQNMNIDMFPIKRDNLGLIENPNDLFLIQVNFLDFHKALGISGEKNDVINDLFYKLFFLVSELSQMVYNCPYLDDDDFKSLNIPNLNDEFIF